MKKLLIILLLGFSACCPDKDVPNKRDLKIIITYLNGNIDTINTLNVTRLYISDYDNTSLKSENGNLMIRNVASYRIISDTISKSQ